MKSEVTKEAPMKSTRLILNSLFCVALLGSTAMAQATRTFVATTGNDANPCSHPDPCRTLQGALNATGAGGEVVVLDSGGFGSNVTIDKSVSIIASPGVFAGLTVLAGHGIDINAGASDTVLLRGLTISAHGGNDGIVYNTGGTLRIENCAVHGFSQHGGIVFLGAGHLEIKDSSVSDNAFAVAIEGPQAESASASLERVLFDGNFDALLVGDGAKATVRDSVASHNTDAFQAFSRTSAASELTLENCLASSNSGSGIFVDTSSTGPATIRLSNSTVTNNGIGLRAIGPSSHILSRGNNTVEGNTIETSGTIGAYSAR
jgi:hypothetical protein